MPAIRVKDAAVLLGVSDDTVRRWIDGGSLPSSKDESGRKVIAGDVLAEFAREHASPPPDPLGVASSARNRFVGLVTKVTADQVMSRSADAVRALHRRLADEQRVGHTARPRAGCRRRGGGQGHDRHRRNTRRNLMKSIVGIAWRH